MPTDAERSLLDAIAAGDLDDHLDALAAAVGARQALPHTVHSATTLMSLCNLVRINQRISPRYLAGGMARSSRSTATVQLEREIGRFKNGLVRCPPLALEKLTA
jgi:hypothetical protein